MITENQQILIASNHKKFKFYVNNFRENVITIPYKM
jgi:hypothetical protein